MRIKRYVAQTTNMAFYQIKIGATSAFNVVLDNQEFFKLRLAEHALTFD